MRTFTLILIVAINSLISYGQFAITGRITDSETGEPLVNAHVRIEKTFHSAVSDFDGIYRIRGLKTGDYSVRVTYMGYNPKIKTVSLESDTELNFELESSVFLQDEVIISATRAEEATPATYSNISEKEIEDANFGQDMPYVMRTIPSTVVTSDAGTGIGYTGVRIRGTDITRINVTINGVPLNDPESHAVFWVNMPDLAASVDNIQVQRGVGTSTNGAAAFGASINIKTLEFSPDPFAEISSTAGSFNTFRNNVKFGTGLIDGKWSFSGRLSKISSDGYIDRATADLKSFFLSGSYYGEKSVLKLNVFSGKEKTYFAWYGIPKASLDTNRTYNPYTYENQTDNYQQDHYQMHYSTQLSKNLNLNGALHYTRGRGYYEEYHDVEDPFGVTAFSHYGLEPLIYGNDTIFSTDLIRQKWLENDFYGMTYSLSYKKKKTDITIGGSWNRFDGISFGEIIWMRFAGDTEKGYRWYESDGLKDNFNVYGKFGYNLTKKLNFYGDLQFRRIDHTIKGTEDAYGAIEIDRSFDFFNPKAGLHYSFNNRHSAYLSFAVANREPARQNYINTYLGDEIPGHETLFDYEAGYSFKSSGFILNTNMYYMYYRDQLVQTGRLDNVGYPILTNVPESYRAGIELITGVKVTQWLVWDANATFNQNKILDFTAVIDNFDTWGTIEKEYNNTDIAYSPEVIANSILGFEPLKNLKVDLISKYVSRQYIDNTASKERSIDPYLVESLRVNYIFRPGLFKEVGISLQVNNLLDNEYETYAWVYRYFAAGEYFDDFGYFPQAGINFLASLNLKF